jgi:hypothetical protein
VLVFLFFARLDKGECTAFLDKKRLSLGVAEKHARTVQASNTSATTMETKSSETQITPKNLPK